MMSRSSGISTDEALELLSQDPEFARAWALQEPKVSLAANVSRLRHLRQLTQKQLAEAAGMKQPRIAEMEQASGNPRLDTISRVAIALGVTPAELLATAAAVVPQVTKSLRTSFAGRFDASPRMQ